MGSKPIRGTSISAEEKSPCGSQRRGFFNVQNQRSAEIRRAGYPTLPSNIFNWRVETPGLKCLLRMRPAS